MGLHPNDVIAGYEMALVKAREEIESVSVVPAPELLLTGLAMVCGTVPSSPLPSIDQLAQAVTSAIASKQPGSEAMLSKLVAEASLAVMPKNPRDFNVDSVRVVKVLGGGLDASRVVRGMVFPREPEGA